MKLQCPVCRAFVFERFRLFEVLAVIGGLGALGFAIAVLDLKGFEILLCAVGIIVVEYLIRLIFIWIHNYQNENIY